MHKNFRFDVSEFWFILIFFKFLLPCGSQPKKEWKRKLPPPPPPLHLHRSNRRCLLLPPSSCFNKWPQNLTQGILFSTNMSQVLLRFDFFTAEIRCTCACTCVCAWSEKLQSAVFDYEKKVDVFQSGPDFAFWVSAAAAAGSFSPRLAYHGIVCMTGNVSFYSSSFLIYRINEKEKHTIYPPQTDRQTQRVILDQICSRLFMDRFFYFSAVINYWLGGNGNPSFFPNVNKSNVVV